MGGDWQFSVQIWIYPGVRTCEIHGCRKTKEKAYSKTINPNFDIQIDDVSVKALSHNSLLSVFQMIAKLKKDSEWNSLVSSLFSECM